MDRNNIGGNFSGASFLEELGDLPAGSKHTREDVRAYAKAVAKEAVALDIKGKDAFSAKWGGKVDDKKDLSQYEKEKSAVRAVSAFLETFRPVADDAIEGVSFFANIDKKYNEIGSYDEKLKNIEKALKESKVFELGYKPSILGTLPSQTDKTPADKTPASTSKSPGAQQASLAAGGDPKVAEYQRMLEKAGFSLGTYGADGKLGPTTSKQITAFQKKHGLPLTGSFDAATVAKLRSVTGMGPSGGLGAMVSTGTLKKVGLVLAGVAVVGGVYYVMTSED